MGLFVDLLSNFIDNIETDRKIDRQLKDMEDFCDRIERRTRESEKQEREIREREEQKREEQKREEQEREARMREEIAKQEKQKTTPDDSPKKTEENDGINNTEQFVLACYSIALAAGHADGNLSAEEIGELELFINKYLGTHVMSPEADAKLQKLKENPPTFTEAVKEVIILKKNGISTKVFRTLITTIIHSDNVLTPEEENFIEMWDSIFPESKDE